MKIYMILVGTLLILSACTTPTGNVVKEEIEIGGIYMLTGVSAQQGQHALKGAQLAIEEINVAGGINGRQLKLIAEDNQDDKPAVAISAYKKLKSQGINIILGPNWSPSGMALAPIACEEKTLMISPSVGVAEFNEACDYIYNLWPHDFIHSEKLGRIVVNQGYERIVIIGSQQAWEYEQAEAVKKGVLAKGGNIVGYHIATSDETDFGTIVTKTIEAQPDAVIFTNLGRQHVPAKKLREMRSTAQYFTTTIIEENIEAAQGSFENTKVMTSFTPTEKFVQKFTEKYGEAPTINSDTSYDTVMVLAQAMKETKSTNVEVLKDYLSKLKTFSGVSGEITFDEHGAAMREAVMYTIVNGERENT